MAPTKAKVTKQKRVSPFTNIVKSTKRAAVKDRLPQKNQSSDEQAPVAVHQDLSQKLDAVLKMVTDLATRVTAYEGRQKQGEAAVTPSPPTSPTRRRAGHQGHLPPTLRCIRRSLGMWPTE